MWNTERPYFNRQREKQDSVISGVLEWSGVNDELEWIPKQEEIPGP